MRVEIFDGVWFTLYQEGDEYILIGKDRGEGCEVRLNFDDIRQIYAMLTHEASGSLVFSNNRKGRIFCNLRYDFQRRRKLQIEVEECRVSIGEERKFGEFWDGAAFYDELGTILHNSPSYEDMEFEERKSVDLSHNFCLHTDFSQRIYVLNEELQILGEISPVDIETLDKQLLSNSAGLKITLSQLVLRKNNKAGGWIILPREIDSKLFDPGVPDSEKAWAMLVSPIYLEDSDVAHLASEVALTAAFGDAKL